MLWMNCLHMNRINLNLSHYDRNFLRTWNKTLDHLNNLIGRGDGGEKLWFVLFGCQN